MNHLTAVKEWWTDFGNTPSRSHSSDYLRPVWTSSALSFNIPPHTCRRTTPNRWTLLRLHLPARLRAGAQRSCVAPHVTAGSGRYLLVPRTKWGRVFSRTMWNSTVLRWRGPWLPQRKGYASSPGCCTFFLYHWRACGYFTLYDFHLAQPHMHASQVHSTGARLRLVVHREEWFFSTEVRVLSIWLICQFLTFLPHPHS